MDRRVVYFVWGPPRSGTTWLFNVAKEMLSAAHVDRYAYGDGADLPPQTWSNSVVIKAHKADPAELVTLFQSRIELCALVILRRPDHAFRSLVRTQKASRSELLGWLERDVASLEATLPVLTNVQLCREEWIQDRSPQIVGKLSELNDLNLSPAAIQEISEKFERERVRSTVNELTRSRKWTLDFENFDPETHWHALHIGPTVQPELELSAEEQVRLALLGDRIDALTGQYSMWNQSGNTREFSATATATATAPREYLAARDASLQSKPRRRWRNGWRLGGGGLTVAAFTASSHAESAVTNFPV